MLVKFIKYNNFITTIYLLLFFHNHQVSTEKMWSPRKQLCFVNMERKKAGLQPLKIHNALMKAANLHSKDMSAHHNMDHKGSDGSSPADRMKRLGIKYLSMGENVARGQRNTNQVMHDWMHSPGHRANILNHEFTHFGAGFIERGNFWAQEFAKFHSHDDEGAGQELPPDYYNHDNCSDLQEIVDIDGNGHNNGNESHKPEEHVTTTPIQPVTDSTPVSGQTMFVVPQSTNSLNTVTSPIIQPPLKQPLITTQIIPQSSSNVVQQISEIQPQTTTQILTDQPLVQTLAQPITQELIPLNYNGATLSYPYLLQ